jgi:hypothetical protein
MDKSPKDFDGPYFLPGDDDNELVISYFDFRSEMAGGKPIEQTQIGNKYHIAFFKRDVNGDPTFDDTFEAILADPGVYVSGLAGANVYGCMVKKTDKSGKWFEDYLDKTAKQFTMKKLLNTAKAILETR